jgi:hypothetical protein
MPKGARKPKEPEVMGAAEASVTLGVTQNNLRTVAGLPDPYDKIRASTLYRADEIRELATARNARRAERVPA